MNLPSFVLCKIWIYEFFAYLTFLVSFVDVWTKSQLKIPVKYQSIRRSTVLKVPQIVSFADFLTLLNSRMTTWYLRHSHLNYSYASIWSVINANYKNLSSGSHGKHPLRIDKILNSTVELYSYRNFWVWHKVISSDTIGLNYSPWDRCMPPMIEFRPEKRLIKGASHEMLVNNTIDLRHLFFDSENIVKRIVTVFKPKAAFGLQVEGRVLFF